MGGKEFGQTGAEKRIHPEEDSADAALAECVAEALHGSLGEIGRLAGGVAEQEAGIAVGRDRVARAGGGGLAGKEAAAMAQEVGDEKLAVALPGPKGSHFLRLLPLAVEQAIVRTVVEIVGQTPEDGGPLGFIGGQVPVFHHSVSDQTVGKTAGSLKSGSPLGRVRQSFSSKM